MDLSVQCSFCSQLGHQCNGSVHGCRRPKTRRPDACESCRTTHQRCDGSGLGCQRYERPETSRQYRNRYIAPCDTCRIRHQCCNGSALGCQKRFQPQDMSVQISTFTCRENVSGAAQCVSTFATTGALAKHRLQEHGIGKKCALCGFTTPTNAGVFKHIRRECRNVSRYLTNIEVQALIQDEFPESEAADAGSKQDTNSIMDNDGRLPENQLLLASRQRLSKVQLYYRQ